MIWQGTQNGTYEGQFTGLGFQSPGEGQGFTWWVGSEEPEEEFFALEKRKQHTEALSCEPKGLESKPNTRVPTVAQGVKNPTSIHEVASLIPIPTQWVKDQVLP